MDIAKFLASAPRRRGCVVCKNKRIAGDIVIFLDARKSGKTFASLSYFIAKYLSTIPGCPSPETVRRHIARCLDRSPVTGGKR